MSHYLVKDLGRHLACIKNTWSDVSGDDDDDDNYSFLTCLWGAKRLLRWWRHYSFLICLWGEKNRCLAKKEWNCFLPSWVYSSVVWTFGLHMKYIRFLQQQASVILINNFQHMLFADVKNFLRSEKISKKGIIHGMPESQTEDWIVIHRIKWISSEFIMIELHNWISTFPFVLFLVFLYPLGLNIFLKDNVFLVLFFFQFESFWILFTITDWYLLKLLPS